MNSFFVPMTGGPDLHDGRGWRHASICRPIRPGTYRGMSANYSGAGFSDMYFKVDAVPAERDLAQWAGETRSHRPCARISADLCSPGPRPSKAVNIPSAIDGVAPDLFKRHRELPIDTHQHIIALGLPDFTDGRKMNLLGKLNMGRNPIQQTDSSWVRQAWWAWSSSSPYFRVGRSVRVTFPYCGAVDHHPSTSQQIGVMYLVLALSYAGARLRRCDHDANPAGPSRPAVRKATYRRSISTRSSRRTARS